jgi:hypothetical protein
MNNTASIRALPILKTNKFSYGGRDAHGRPKFLPKIRERILRPTKYRPEVPKTHRRPSSRPSFFARRARASFYVNRMRAMMVAGVQKLLDMSKVGVQVWRAEFQTSVNK